MKKILSSVLAITLLLSSTLVPAFADGGYGENNTNVKDDIPENSDPKSYTVAFCDFENVTGFSQSGSFDITDTTESAYGKALTVLPSSWATAAGSTANATYTYDGKTHNLFREELVVNKNYIMSYQYKTVTETTRPAPFTLCPTFEQFKMSDGDYRDLPPYVYNKWSTRQFGFTAESTSASVKINTYASQCKSYIDNYKITEAATVTVNGANYQDIVVLKAGNVLTGNKNGLVLAEKGLDTKFTLSLPDGLTAIVKHGSKTLTPSEGEYHIEKLTSDITIDVVFDLPVFQKNFTCLGDKVYLQSGITYGEMLNKMSIGSANTAISVKRNGKAVPSDRILATGDVLCFNGIDDTYTVIIDGDINGDGRMTVVDMVCLGEKITKENTKYPFSDIDGDGKTTVSDMIKLRMKILTDNTNFTYSPSKTALAAINTLKYDTINKASLGIMQSDIDASVYNQGNRTRLARVIRKAMKGENIVISTFGGSITQGSGQRETPKELTNNFTDTMNYAEALNAWFNEVFGEYGCKSTLENAGIGATDTPYGIHRMQEDVLDKNPDIVIIEWDMNDNTDEYKQATYENMILKLLDTDVAVIMMGFCGGKNNLGTQKMHEPLSDYYDIPYVSYRNAFSEKTYVSKLTNDNVHPNIVGHHLAAMLLESYIASVYADIENIGTVVTNNIPSVPYNSGATEYGKCYVASLADIEDGKFSNIKLISKGSFKKDSFQKDFGVRKYYGYSAQFATSYEPMVLEISNCHTLMTLMARSNGMADAKYELEIDGTKITSNTFTCSAASATDNNQIENQYHWASERACYYPEGKNITLKIYPTNKTSPEYVRLFALLLS